MMLSHCIDKNQKQPENFEFSKENKSKCKEIIAKYPKTNQKSAVMPLLDLVQEQDGWICYAAIKHVAELLNMNPINVEEVATFYTMYKLRPIAKHHVQLCTNISCWLRGSDDVKKAMKDVCNLNLNQSSEHITFEEVECLGACVNAPVMQINKDYYEDLNYDNAKKIFEDIINNKQVKHGSQVNRINSAPQSGPKTLIDLNNKS